ncbi:hypothetical protein AB0K11_01620 [Mycobacterium sp. NPDC050551]|uniref:hypothetical protein n=1 Tax=Mycobacterium sp. NPDC050551 TaxID=3155407 RepID=UPI0034412407
MHTTKMMAHTVAVAVISGAIAAAGLGLGAGFAAAENPTGTWCPGQPVPLGPLADFGWDDNVCHDYWYVPFGEGNVPITNIPTGEPVKSHIWIGSPPGRTPPPPPAPPAPGSYCATNPVGCHFFGP